MLKYDPDSAVPYCLKAPAEVLDVSIDWTQWLDWEGAAGIDGSDWSIPAALTKQDESNASGVTAVLFSGGTLGQEYWLTNTITAGAKTGERSIRVKLVRR